MVGPRGLEGFRISDAPERITEDRLHEIEKAEGEGTIGFDVVPEVRAKGLGEDRSTFGRFSLQGRT